LKCIKKGACLFFDHVHNYANFLQRQYLRGIEIHRVIHRYCGQTRQALIEEGLTAQSLLRSHVRATLRALFRFDLVERVAAGALQAFDSGFCTYF
jgi:hypothetical protein